jgi:hypothetical protein
VARGVEDDAPGAAANLLKVIAQSPAVCAGSSTPPRISMPKSQPAVCPADLNTHSRSSSAVGRTPQRPCPS